MIWGIVMNGAGDLYHLLLAGDEARHHGSGIGAEVERLQELLTGDVDTAQAFERLGVAQIKILRDCQRGNEARFLVHHRDAVAERVGGICQRDFSSHRTSRAAPNQ